MNLTLTRLLELHQLTERPPTHSYSTTCIQAAIRPTSQFNQTNYLFPSITFLLSTTAMSLHSTVFPRDLQQHKQELEHVPLETAETTQTGGIHLGGGPHAKEAEYVHQQRVQEQHAGTTQSYCDWSRFGVNPDVVKCNPPSLCRVQFRNKELMLGQVLLQPETQTPPTVDWPPVKINTVKDAPQLYTIIMCDPDAPSPQDPKFRHWAHWIVVNTPSGHQLDQGYTVLKYQGPSPPKGTGLHRYVFLVYAQKELIGSGHLKQLSDSSRKSWSLDGFLKTHQFEIDGSMPIAGNMFRCANPETALSVSEGSAPIESTPATKHEGSSTRK